MALLYRTGGWHKVFSASDVRTDLALEAHAAARGTGPQEMPGVTVNEERGPDVSVTRMEIFTPQAAQLLGKTMGRYVTIEAPALRRRNRQLQEEVAGVLARELAALMNLNPWDEVLVVGLGNWNATPDALGPRVVGGLLVSRHLRAHVPPELANRLRGVAALAPGVLGLTGIETGEIVRGVVDRAAPQAVIVVDALAARSIDRIATTIQLADTGINPGSGVGNPRASITRDNLGVPVYAIGVPTVVHAVTIANDTLDLVASQLQAQEPAWQPLAAMDRERKHSLISQVLSPEVGDLVVTPKEIDVLIRDISRAVAGGVNAALHPAIGREEMAIYTDA